MSSTQTMRRPIVITASAAALLLASACGSAAAAQPPSATPAAALAPTPTLVPTAEPTATAPPTATPLAPPAFLEPAGCQEPPDDYSRIHIGDWQFDQRTYAMLQHAAELYGGPLDVTGAALTQGSYSDNGPASFGTHLGDGAVDISVIRPGGRSVLYDEIEPLIRALRTAGFAAWLRDWSELSEGSDIHIHAVAIGDAELSQAAADQLTGEFGYFYGYNGLSPANGIPIPDRHGGPIICQWMLDWGYADLRAPSMRAGSGVDWQARLREAAAKFVQSNTEETQQLARDLDFRPGPNEDSSNMCGPLAAAILRDAGLLPSTVGPVADIRSYWLANPKEENSRPWSLFPARDYDLYHFDTPLSQFDFTAWPLRPGDFLYTYQGRDGYEHMFIVTEVDAQGRAYTVTNNKQRDLTYIVQRVMLYDPADPTAGVFHNDWVNSAIVGRTGMEGFDVLRRKGVSLPPGTLFDYAVRPGDTVITIAAEFGSTFAAVVAENQLLAPYTLAVGQLLRVPVNVALAPESGGAADAAHLSNP